MKQTRCRWGARSATAAVLVLLAGAGAGCHLIFPYTPGATDGGPGGEAGSTEAGGPTYCTVNRLIKSPYAGGDGTTSSPYTLCTIKQLAAVDQNPDRSFKLMRDLTFPEKINNHTRLGASTAFRGEFDGAGHRLFGVSLELSTTSGVGFFAQVSGGVIKDLRLEQARVIGKSLVGGLVAIMSGGVIRNCSVSGKVEAREQLAGGLVGRIKGSAVQIVNCHSTADVLVMNSHAGGLAGYNEGGSIDKSSAAGKVSVTRKGNCAFAGGLVGNNDGSIRQSFATGAVRAQGAVAGGLVGWNTNLIADCYATGQVTAGVTGPGKTCSTSSSVSYAGGLVGINCGGDMSMYKWDCGVAFKDATIQRCYSGGGVTAGGSDIGGLVGLVAGPLSAVEASFTVGAATSTSSSAVKIGGIVGRVMAGGSLSGSYWDTHLGKVSLACGAGDTGKNGCDIGRGIDTSLLGNNTYFFSKVNPPLNTWNFKLPIWYEQTGGYPTLK